MRALHGRTTSQLLMVGLLTTLLAGCANTGVAAAARAVRVISGEEAKACRFIDAVSTFNTHTMVDDPQKDARNRALNRVQQLGGNSLVIRNTNFQLAPSGIGGIFTLMGEAYSCSAPVG
jgi:hypothetical protein